MKFNEVVPKEERLGGERERDTNGGPNYFCNMKLKRSKSLLKRIDDYLKELSVNSQVLIRETLNLWTHF